MPRKAKADQRGQLHFPGMAGARFLRTGRGRRKRNPETSLMSACTGLAAHSREIVWSCRLNSGLAFQGRRVFVARGTLHTDQGVIHLTNRWVMLDPSAIQLAPEGTFDQVHLLRGGKLLATEYKTGDEQPTKEQAELLARIRDGGGDAFVVSEIEHFERILRIARERGGNVMG